MDLDHQNHGHVVAAHDKHGHSSLLHYPNAKSSQPRQVKNGTMRTKY
jgi:hypothetical protein